MDKEIEDVMHFLKNVEESLYKTFGLNPPKTHDQMIIVTPNGVFHSNDEITTEDYKKLFLNENNGMTGFFYPSWPVRIQREKYNPDVKFDNEEYYVTKDDWNKSRLSIKLREEEFGSSFNDSKYDGNG